MTANTPQDSISAQFVSPGVLYIVATPIGNLADISDRAKQVLQDVDLILAEDTRHTKPLLQHFAITTRLRSCHEHNEQQVTGEVMRLLQQGQSIALVSDAGTPLISDPGYVLVREAHQNEIKVVPVPGASAPIAALSASGLPTDRFYFVGFLPAKRAARIKALDGLRDIQGTLLFFESSHRILASLQDCLDVFGDRQVVMARELTKTFETIQSSTLSELCEFVAKDSNQQRGEFVIMLAGKTANDGDTDFVELDRTLGILMQQLPLSQASEIGAKLLKMKKNKVYQRALELERGA